MSSFNRESEDPRVERENHKDASTSKYVRKHAVCGGKRRNAKEERRRNHLVRLSNKKRRKNLIKVHSGESCGGVSHQFSDAPPSTIGFVPELFDDDFYDDVPPNWHSLPPHPRSRSSQSAFSEMREPAQPAEERLQRSLSEPLPPPRILRREESSLDSEDISGSPPSIPSRTSLVRERNEMAHVATDALPQPPLHTLDPSVIDAVSEMRDQVADIPDDQQEQVETWLGHAENLLIFAFQVHRASSIMDVFAATAAYIKMYVKGKSVVHQLYSLINDMPKAEEDEVSVHGWTDEIVNKWDLFIKHPIFNRVSYLISAALSITVSSMKELVWTVNGLEIIRIPALKEQIKAVDLVDAVVRTDRKSVV